MIRVAARRCGVWRGISVGVDQTATQPPGSAHPDFGSHYCCGNPLGTVLATLGSDDKPIYNPADAAGDYNVGVGLTGPRGVRSMVQRRTGRQPLLPGGL